MLTGMGAANPNLSKGGRKLKKAKHYTISKTLDGNEKKRDSGMRTESSKRNATMEIMQIDAPKQVWGCLKVDTNGKFKDESECRNVELYVQYG